MIIKFIFNAPTNTGIIEKICIRVAQSCGVKLGLSRDLENIYAYIEADEENIEAFSRELAGELPLSVFLKSLKAEICEEFEDDLKRDFPFVSQPPCPKCIKEVKDKNSKHYFDIFHHCEVCGYEVISKPEIEAETVIKNIAKKLKNSSVFVQTMNGKFEISKDIENADIIVARDLAVIAKYFLSFEGDAKALASIEKPLVTLKTNLEFKKNFGVSTPAFEVKLPDDMILELIFEAGEFELLGLKNSEKTEDLSFEVKVEKTPKAVVTDSRTKDVLLYTGERGLVPYFEKEIQNGVKGKYKEFCAISSDEKTVIDICGDGKAAKPAYASFYGVMKQWELEEKNIMGFCFYKEDESKVFLHSPKFGLVEYIDFHFRFKNFEEIFSLISTMNDTGKKLVSNFKNKRNELFVNALNADISSSTNGIYYLWGLIGNVLGFGNDIKTSAEMLLKYANEAMTKKGPRIDYKVQNNILDPLWAIRTAMSFNLAGVDDYLISFGVIESFAEFLSNSYESVNRDTKLNGAVIAGDLFEGEFLNKIYSYIDKNYPVFTPRGLPLTGQIEAFGSSVINAKITG